MLIKMSNSNDWKDCKALCFYGPCHHMCLQIISTGRIISQQDQNMETGKLWVRAEMMFRENDHCILIICWFNVTDVLSRQSKHRSPDMMVKIRISASRAMSSGQTEGRRTLTPPGDFLLFFSVSGSQKWRSGMFRNADLLFHDVPAPTSSLQ